MPQVFRLMALAIHMQDLVDRGEVAGYARLAHVSRPRITLIVNLLLLAPYIQEAILCLPDTVGGCGAVGERAVRRICAVVDWRRQRGMW